MSFSLGENLSPLPVSTRTRLPAASISRQRVAYSQRLSASHDTSFDHSVLGTTPCMAPPSTRKFPPLSMVSFASPMVSTKRILALAVPTSSRAAIDRSARLSHAASVRGFEADVNVQAPEDALRLLRDHIALNNRAAASGSTAYISTSRHYS